MLLQKQELTHWGRVTHICVGNLTSIGSDNGLLPGRRQAIIWTNAGILLIGPLGTNFSEILMEIHTFSFKKMHLKMLSAKWRPFCLGLNVLKYRTLVPPAFLQQASNYYLKKGWPSSSLVTSGVNMLNFAFDSFGTFRREILLESMECIL